MSTGTDKETPKIGEGLAGPGRPKGMPNKATQRTREAIAMIAEGMSGDFMQWIRQTAEGIPEANIKPDPKGAADVYLKAIEYHIPKLSRVEGHITPGSEKTHEQWLDSLK